MGAFSEFFGFEGRISRLGYLWRCLSVGLGIGVLSIGGGAFLDIVVRPLGQAGYDAGVHGLAVGIMLAARGASAAISSRRLRDMGVEPIHVVPAYFALWLVYALLLQPLSRAQPDRYAFLTVCWALLQGMPTLALILWPGH